MDLNKFKPLGEWVVLEMDKSRKHKLIELPDAVAKNSPMARIIMAGPDMPKTLGVGQIVVDGSSGKWRKAHAFKESKTGLRFYICPWHAIVARIYEGKTIPLGRRVLVERIFEKPKAEGIAIPDLVMDNLQSMKVKIVRYGLTNKGDEFRTGGLPTVGTVCKLTKWGMHMVEIGILHQYHLIVNEEDLEYKES